MPDTTKTESVLLKVDIYHRPERVEFCVMHTPSLLWEALPQRPQKIHGDDENSYFKRFTVRYQGKGYAFTFYHVRRP